MDINDEDLTVILDKITALRHELHKIPEVSMKEYRTKQEIMDFISDNTMLGLNDCGAWFYAVKKSGRTDLERGNRFPRGHDGHSSILAGLKFPCTELRAMRHIQRRERTPDLCLQSFCSIFRHSHRRSMRKRALYS